MADLKARELVVQTRTLAGAELFRINIANQVVKKLIELNNFLCWGNEKESSLEVGQVV